MGNRKIQAMGLIGNAQAELFELCSKSREKRVNSITPNDYFESYCSSLFIYGLRAQYNLQRYYLTQVGAPNFTVSGFVTRL